jgi:tetratricopeptide (TPR) repeat protein
VGSATKSLVRFDTSGKKWTQQEDMIPQMQVMEEQTDSGNIHVGRKKDPPTVYFMSGLEYFRNGDFTRALKNFRYADSVGRKPVYRLWIGKAYRQLGQPDKMIEIMKQIVARDPECNVADDALFEMAAYYQNTDDYEKATALYAQLAEQYPFGETYSTGEKSMEVANERRRFMRAEINNMLASLGHTDEDAAVNIRNFQKGHRLIENGIAERETVQSIRAAYQRLAEKELLRATGVERAARTLRWAIGAGGLGLLIIIASVVQIIQARALQRHMQALSENIGEFKVRGL